MGDIDEELLEDLYGWVDQIPFSRPKRDIKRDFSDGVLVAEIANHFCPRLVEVHNYVPASKLDLKATNWRLMNRSIVSGTYNYYSLVVNGHVLVGEAVRFYFPKYVDLHNYIGTTSTKQKKTNWQLLNRKVFKKLGFEVTDDVIHNITTCKPWAVEQFLMMLRRKIDRHIYERERDKQNRNVSDRPEVDQDYKGSTGNVGQNYDMNSSFPNKNDSGYSIGVTNSGHNTTNQKLSNQSITKTTTRTKDLVPKVQVEEKEQEILVKDETIQILQAKVRRLEHLLHLKDIRIDDLQQRLDQLEVQLRPTANFQPKKK